MKIVSVFAIDNHPVYLESIGAVLNAAVGIRVVGMARSYPAAEKAMRGTRPDVVLMELVLPEVDGLAATRLLLKRNPAVRVVIFTGNGRPEYVQEAKKAGAAGFLAKTCSIPEIVEAIKLAHGGGMVFAWESGASAMPLCALECSISKRERETLALLCAGRTAKEIAAVMNLSPRTVEWYKKALMEKVKARNAVALSQFGFRHGYAGI